MRALRTRFAIVVMRTSKHVWRRSACSCTARVTSTRSRARQRTRVFARENMLIFKKTAPNGTIPSPFPLHFTLRCRIVGGNYGRNVVLSQPGSPWERAGGGMRDGGTVRNWRNWKFVPNIAFSTPAESRNCGGINGGMMGA